MGPAATRGQPGPVVDYFVLEVCLFLNTKRCIVGVGGWAEQKKLLVNRDSTSSSEHQQQQEEKPKENAIPRRVSSGRKRALEKGLS